ncbi:hypothetical protein ACH4L5_36810 [Streptomyces sp. NPDC017405]|uniref:hypothetical protein n=1 Tax=unclassified Streptomyces TaxID=2593676 RepID=UPI0037BB2008
MSWRISGTQPERRRVERTTAIATAVRSLGREQAIVFLAVVFYNASFGAVAEKLGLDEDRVRRVCQWTASALRHPSRGLPLQDFVYGDEAGRSLLIDADLRALVRE